MKNVKKITLINGSTKFQLYFVNCKKKHFLLKGKYNYYAMPFMVNDIVEYMGSCSGVTVTKAASSYFDDKVVHYPYEWKIVGRQNANEIFLMLNMLFG